VDIFSFFSAAQRTTNNQRKIINAWLSEYAATRTRRVYGCRVWIIFVCNLFCFPDSNTSHPVM